MNEEQLKHAIQELVAACESQGADFRDDPEFVDEYLVRIGFHLDPNATSPEEMEQLEHFHDEFCKAWQQREAEGHIDDRIRDAFSTAKSEIRLISDIWHDEHSSVDEFWPNFTCSVDLQELDEFIENRDGLLVSTIRDLLHYYDQQAESEYHAMEQKRLYRWAVKKVLSEMRDGFYAIRAKARVVKNEDNMVVLTVKHKLPFDVSRVPAMTASTTEEST